MADVPENPSSVPFPEPAGAGAPPPFQPIAAPSQAYAPAGQVYPPPAQPAPAPLKKGGSSALKIILIVVGIFVFLILLVVGVVGYIGYRVAHSIRKAADGTMTMSTPGGVVSMGDASTFTEADLGVPIYPGATPGHGSMRMTLPTGPVVAANYVTTDSVAQVVAFYKDKLGSGATSMEFGSTAMLAKTTGDHDSISITVSAKGGDGGKTQIRIQHTVKN